MGPARRTKAGRAYAGLAFLSASLVASVGSPFDSQEIAVEADAKVALSQGSVHPFLNSMARLTAMARVRRLTGQAAALAFARTSIRARQALLVKGEAGSSLASSLVVGAGGLSVRPADSAWARSSAIERARAVDESLSSALRMPWLMPHAAFLDVRDGESDDGRRDRVAVLDDGSWSRFDFMRGRWRSWKMISPGVHRSAGRWAARWMVVGPDGSDGLGLLTDQGFFRLDASSDRFSAAVPWPAEVLQFANVHNAHEDLGYRLLRTGEVQVRTGERWQPVDLGGRAREIAAVVLFDGYEVTSKIAPGRTAQVASGVTAR